MSETGDVPTVPDGATVRGPGTIGRLPDLVAEAGARRVLLVCGRRSFDASGAARILPELGSVAEVHRWDDHRPNPTAQDIAAGLAVAHQHRPDVIVGVGGGSTLDTAKLVAALHAGDDGSDPERTAQRIGTHRVDTPRDVGLILAPTTSGSGAQATHFATVYVGATKHSVAGAALLPDRVILDPALALSGTPYQRACSGIDALAQAIESLWAVGADETSRRDAHAAVGLLAPAVVPFAEAPDEASAAAMATGSHLAGAAINRSRTTLPHALSYALTQHVGLPHGHAVAHTLPAVVERHVHAGPDRLVGITPAEHAHAIGRLADALGVDDGADAAAEVERLVTALGLREAETGQHAAIIADADRLAGSVDPVRLANNPVRFTPAELRAIVLAGTTTGTDATGTDATGAGRSRP